MAATTTQTPDPLLIADVDLLSALDFTLVGRIGGVDAALLTGWAAVRQRLYFALAEVAGPYLQDPQTPGTLIALQSDLMTACLQDPAVTAVGGVQVLPPGDGGTNRLSVAVTLTIGTTQAVLPFTFEGV